jgi:hypothetical protein
VAQRPLSCADPSGHRDSRRTVSHIRWQIPDPREMPPKEFRKVRDLIGAKVKELLMELGVS